MLADRDRARAALLRDPLLEQLRRISRQVAVDASINDSPAELRRKLRSNAPHQLVAQLHESTKAMFTTRPSYTVSAPVTPRQRVSLAPGPVSATLTTQRLDWEDDTSSASDHLALQERRSERSVQFSRDDDEKGQASPPRTELPQIGRPAADSSPTALATEASSGEGVVFLTETNGQLPNASVQPMAAPRPGVGAPQPVTAPISPRRAPPSRPSPRNPAGGGAKQAAGGKPPQRRPHATASAVVMPPPTASEQLRGGPTYLSGTGQEYRSAATYLGEGGVGAEQEGKDEPQAATPNHSTVLSRVIASAERLELEIAQAVISATADDATKAVESARLQALRAHVIGLRAVQQQCLHMQRAAEKAAAKLETKLTATKKELKLKQQEVSWPATLVPFPPLSSPAHSHLP